VFPPPLIENTRGLTGCEAGGWLALAGNRWENRSDGGKIYIRWCDKTKLAVYITDPKLRKAADVTYRMGVNKPTCERVFRAVGHDRNLCPKRPSARRSAPK
jgi:hypothetical protein